MKRLGCLSFSGIFASATTLLIFATIIFFRGGLLFSPGALNAQASGRELGGVLSHAEIAGRCSACHPAAWQAVRMDDLCMECHPDILSASNVLHAELLHNQLQNCRACHLEHRGAEAALTQIDLDSFPHAATGYFLDAHATMADGSPFECAGCHTGTVSSFDPAVCADCHRQLDPGYIETHLVDFGAGCLACHDGLDTYGADFDHHSTAFPLDGEHAALACSSCHLGDLNQVDLRSTPTECIACHAEDDRHQGQFGQNCAVCHTTQDWAEASFDHNQTSFPLTGAHLEADCELCHTDAVYAGTPQDCFSCHAAVDPHGGEFGQDCEACHTTAGWEQVDFDHQHTAFPLTGAHQAVECADCHRAGPDGESVFTGTPVDCAGCHADPAFHQGLFAGDCADCHQTESWSPAQFDLAHTFPIRHGSQTPSECRVCHPDALQAYTCYGCHEHNPAGIESEHREEGIRDFQDCMRCHPTGQEGEGEGHEGGDD